MIADIKIERKGYNRFQVEDIVKSLEDKVAAQSLEIESLKNQLDNLQEEKKKLESMRELIESTLINAEISARKTKDNAENEARSIIEKAKGDADSYLTGFDDKINELEDIKKRVEYILRSQLSVVENIDKRD